MKSCEEIAKGITDAQELAFVNWYSDCEREWATNAIAEALKAEREESERRIVAQFSENKEVYRLRVVALEERIAELERQSTACSRSDKTEGQ